jgi:hypothetical protein
MTALNAATAATPAAAARPRTLIGLAAIGIGVLALADQLIGPANHALLRSFWPLLLVLAGLINLLTARHPAPRLAGGALMAAGLLILSAKLGLVAPQTLRSWWPLLPILAGSVLLAKAWWPRTPA